MRYEILTMLREEGEISGERISEKLNISRAAVSKHIRSLRQEGYVIDSLPGKGYRFISSPDILSPAEIYSHMSNQENWNIITLEEVDSTNIQLRKLADRGAPEFTVVIAEQQTAGKGRLGRPWFSPAGSGLWMSVLLRPQLSPQLAQLLTLTTAVSLEEAFRQLGMDVRIKWPNDILTPGRKKLCGVRSEMHVDMDRVEWLILGIGVNINPTAFPRELQDIAISLYQLKGEPIPRAKVAAAILGRLLANYRLLQQEGFTSLRTNWLNHALGIGETVAIDQNGVKEEGIALGLDEEGYLLLKQGDQVKRVLAGDMVLSV